MADIMYTCPQCGRKSPQPVREGMTVWCTGIQHKKKGYSVRMKPKEKK